MKTSNDATAEIRGLPIFADAAERDLALLAVGLERAVFAAGDTVFRQGAPADCALFLAGGEVEILTRLPGGEDVAIARCGPGAMIGEMSLVEDAVRTASVRCVTPVTAFRMDRRFFRAALAQHSAAAFRILHQVMQTMARRLNEVNARIVTHAARGVTRPCREIPLARRETIPDAAPEFDFRQFLPALPFFQEFRDEETDELLRMARPLALPRDVLLFDEGDEARAAWIVVRGSLTLSCRRDGCRYPLGLVGPGAACGADELIDGQTRGRAGHTTAATALLEFPAAAFHELLARRSPMSFRFQTALCDVQLGSLGRANRRLSHEVTQIAMRDG